MIIADQDKLTEGVETLEDGIKYALGDELYRLNRLGEFSIEAESVDHITVLDYGDFAEEFVQCPSCEVYYALKKDVEYIEENGACRSRSRCGTRSGPEPSLTNASGRWIK